MVMKTLASVPAQSRSPVRILTTYVIIVQNIGWKTRSQLVLYTNKVIIAVLIGFDQSFKYRIVYRYLSVWCRIWNKPNPTWSDFAATREIEIPNLSYYQNKPIKYIRKYLKLTNFWVLKLNCWIQQICNQASWAK